MKKLVIAAASAVLLAGTATIAAAQEAQPGAEELIKKPGASATGEAKGGKAQGTVEGQAEGTTEMAPGQQPSGQAQGEQQQAPGEQPSGQAQGEQQPAPGEQPSGQAQGEQQPTPGEQPSDQAQGEQKPSTETTGSIDISTEQRTEITQVFRSEKVDRIDVDFEVNVGVVVPRTVTLRSLPARVIEIVPAYRGYEYFVLADGRIIIVEPGTLKVVYILVV